DNSDPYNLLEQVSSDQTNNQAEIYAVIYTIETCENKMKLLEIMINSKYVINMIESWIKKWEQNGWITKLKEP
ncbi:10534_t:CDS:1, partial [Dentiscutata heterogama]